MLRSDSFDPIKGQEALVGASAAIVCIDEDTVLHVIQGAQSAGHLRTLLFELRQGPHSSVWDVATATRVHCAAFELELEP